VRLARAALCLKIFFAILKNLGGEALALKRLFAALCTNIFVELTPDGIQHAAAFLGQGFMSFRKY
jgi:hypothetical protein